MGKPVILLASFSGEGSWGDWLDDFNNVAALNSWDAKQKLLWLKKLPDDAKGSFDAAVKALGERFESQSKRELYITKFQMCQKRKTEGWADFGNGLRVPADRAFPQLNTEAKQLLALQQYMGQIDNLQTALP